MPSPATTRPPERLGPNLVWSPVLNPPPPRFVVMAVPEVVAEIRSEETGVQIELRSDDKLLVRWVPDRLGWSLMENDPGPLSRILLALFHRSGTLVEARRMMLGEKEIVFQFKDVSVSKPSSDTVWLVGDHG